MYFCVLVFVCLTGWFCSRQGFSVKLWLSWTHAADQAVLKLAEKYVKLGFNLPVYAS